MRLACFTFSGQAEALNLTPDDRAISPPTVCFDLFCLEAFTPLIGGASISLATKEEVGDPELLAEAIARDDATLINGTPSLYMSMVQVGDADVGVLQM